MIVWRELSVSKIEIFQVVHQEHQVSQEVLSRARVTRAHTCVYHSPGKPGVPGVGTGGHFVGCAGDGCGGVECATRRMLCDFAGWVSILLSFKCI